MQGKKIERKEIGIVGIVAMISSLLLLLLSSSVKAGDEVLYTDYVYDTESFHLHFENVAGRDIKAVTSNGKKLDVTVKGDKGIIFFKKGTIKSGSEIYIINNNGVIGATSIMVKQDDGSADVVARKDYGIYYDIGGLLNEPFMSASELGLSTEDKEDKVEKPNAPVEKPNDSAGIGTDVKPIPVEEIEVEVNSPQTGNKPSKPVEKPSKPVEKPSKPVEKPTKPVEKSTNKVEKSASEVGQAVDTKKESIAQSKAEKMPIIPEVRVEKPNAGISYASLDENGVYEENGETKVIDKVAEVKPEKQAVFQVEPATKAGKEKEIQFNSIAIALIGIAILAISLIAINAKRDS